jgi:hypothetical protein
VFARVLAALAGLPACAADPPPRPPDLPLAVIEPRVSLALVEQPPGPARVLWAKVSIEPADGRPLTVTPSGPIGDGLVPHATLELRVRWQDHRDDAPIAVGHAGQVVLDWTGSQLAEPGRPAVIAARLELSELQETLARRVDVDGRLIGIELRRDDARSGGVVLDLPPAHLDSLAPAPGGTLESNLQSASPSGIFLTAAGSSPEEREATLDRLIDALPASAGAAREAILAALLYLTGETHGRDAQLWRTWWNQQRQRARP